MVTQMVTQVLVALGQRTEDLFVNQRWSLVFRSEELDGKTAQWHCLTAESPIRVLLPFPKADSAGVTAILP